MRPANVATGTPFDIQFKGTSSVKFLNLKVTEVTNLALPKESLVDWLVNTINGVPDLPFPISVTDLAYNSNPTKTTDPDWTFDISRFVDMT